MVLFLNYAIQGGLIYYLLSVDSEMVCDEETVPRPLLVIAILTFSIYVVADLKEAFVMRSWLSQIPSGPKTEPLKLQKLKAHGSDLTGVVWARYFVVRTVSSLAPCTRVLFYLLVVLPKAAISIAMQYTGNRFLMQAETIEDLVLNAVAIVFILDIDNIIYKTFIIDALKLTTGGVPPLVKNSCTEVGKCGYLLRFPYTFYVFGWIISSVVVSFHVACG
jgi:hypothetical protein